MGKKIRRTMWITLSIIAVLAIGIILYINQPKFGRTPTGARLERVKASPNYRDGKFQNLHPAPQLTESIWTLIGSQLKKKERLSPENIIPSVKTNLFDIGMEANMLVWFGHSSYYIQLGGKRILVDPVFSGSCSPVPSSGKSFKGTDVYNAADIPDLDYLIITHDHYDHLDYSTVMELKQRIKKIVCPLGVGEHFEYWGFDSENVIEMDWNEIANEGSDFEIHCLSAHHFSGRLRTYQSLWASFLLETPDYKIYIGGDSGYGTHFSEIGKRFGGIDLAILENGQYGKGWKHIHMLPAETLQAGKDLHAKQVFPAHNSKFALAHHAWDEPLQEITALHDGEDFTLLTPMIGEVVRLNDSSQVFRKWWEKY